MIKSLKDMYTIVQSYLANHNTVKVLEKQMKKESEDIKQAKVKFKLPDGPATEFDGPAGGITFSTQKQYEWHPQAIKKYFGAAEYANCTEVVVKSDSKDHLKALIDQRDFKNLLCRQPGSGGGR